MSKQQRKTIRNVFSKKVIENAEFNGVYFWFKTGNFETFLERAGTSRNDNFSFTKPAFIPLLSNNPWFFSFLFRLNT